MSMKNGVPYRQWLIPSSKYSLKAPYYMNPKKITYHNTDNQMPASNEISYMRNNNNVTGYHIAVDEKEAIQGIPFNRNAYHAGDGARGYGNRNTIGIEICRNYDRARRTTNLNEPLKSQYSQAEINAVKVGAQIMYEQGIEPVLSNIKFHQDWSGKNCPSKILNERRGAQFKAFALSEAIKYRDRMNASKNAPRYGWTKDHKGWWYHIEGGGYPRGGWRLINKKWYLFDSAGYMLTGWQKSKDKWYYMNNSGHMQKGWIKLNNKWYYLNSSGAMQRFWFKTSTDGPWYYSNSSGAMQTGWLKDKNGRWFYLKENGAMATGLIEVGGKNYYLQRNGVLITDDIVELEANSRGHLK